LFKILFSVISLSGWLAGLAWGKLQVENLSILALSSGTTGTAQEWDKNGVLCFLTFTK
jgi:hypothetical protein